MLTRSLEKAGLSSFGATWSVASAFSPSCFVVGENIWRWLDRRALASLD